MGIADTHKLGERRVFLRNCWYVVAWSSELTDKPLAITVLDEDLVIFRDSHGAPAVLTDRCPHRHVPLSLGCVEARGLRCGYHGLLFDAAGVCIEVPSQSAIPPRARVRAYPAAERHGWVWAWMGDTEAADPALIPDFSMLTDPNFRAVGKTNHVLANYQLVTDNLMDLSHVGYVHQTTIGTPEFTAKGKLTARRKDGGVEVVRLVPEVPTPPTYARTGVLPEGGLIDRWQVIRFVPPCFVTIHVGGKAAGEGGLTGHYAGGLNMWVMNAMTPETARTTHYFWASVRAHALDSTEADALFLSNVGEAFMEDKFMLEAQQRAHDKQTDDWTVAMREDTGSIEARRVLDALIAQEQASAVAAE